jgi:UDP-N-acetyl-2-amino-2-deoxyglucuronate dehydrogenase
MHPRARALAISGIDSALSALGYRDAELASAHSDVVDWARTRARAFRNRSAVVRGTRIVVTGRGRAELRPFDRPLAGPDEVTVEVLASAVSVGTERAQWLRLPNAQPDFPYMPGYSAAGTVLAAGGQVGDLGEGGLVAVARVPHASVDTVPAAWATPVPDGVDVSEAALVYLAVIAGYGVRRAALAPGEPLCVVGAGPIGALTQRLAMLHEPGAVTIVASSRGREGAARSAGAAAFLTAAEGADEVAAATVIEATGDPTALLTAVAAARPGATVVLLGSPRGRTPSAVLADAQRKGLRLVGAHVSALATEARRSPEDPFQALARTFLSALASGELAVADLVGEAVDPREAQLAYRRLARGELAGLHFDWRLLPAADRVRQRSLISAPTLPRRRPQLGSVPVGDHPRAGEDRMRFTLIGCGDVGLHNAAAIAGARNAELVTSFDPVEALAEVTAERFGGTVAATIEEALDPQHVDAVFLCVPHDLHAPLIEQAAAAGLQVVVEKPLANDLDAARRAVDAANRAGVALSVCFPYRYEAAIQAARDLVRRGALGELRGITVGFHADRPESYWVGGLSGRSQSGWRSSLARSGGGVLIMNLTHYLDFVRYLTGVEAERVVAAKSAAPGAEVEDRIAIAVEFRGGALGSISGSVITRGDPHNRFELWGELGTLQLEPERVIYTERALDGVPTGRWCALPPEPDVDPRMLFVEQFAAARIAGRPVDVPAADGLAVQAFIDAAYRSAEHGVAVVVSEREPVEAS